MTQPDLTPLRALRRGLFAGVVGTAVMTASQKLSAALQSGGEGSEAAADAQPADPWEQASTPAKVGRRILSGVFEVEVSSDSIPVLTQAMHWGYGTGWGVAYGLVAGSRPAPRALRGGLAFGTAVWALSYVQLVPMGLYSPPWTYPPKELAMDLSYHLAYGAGTGVGYALASRA